MQRAKNTTETKRHTNKPTMQANKTVIVESVVEPAVITIVKEPTVVETKERATVVHEVVHKTEKIEVQPVIERERETLEVQEIIQPLHEREVLPTEVKYGVLPQVNTADVVESDAAYRQQHDEFVNKFHSSTLVEPTIRSTTELTPIVHEIIKPKIIEEIQPVLEREVEKTTIIKETLPIHERIVEAPVTVVKVMPAKDLGTRFVQESEVRKTM
eukprot:TRINITY_DN19271_c0_g1_i1.p1 TRINITY_DN19271_c0_g1~~TRINITY_DN19271_c0_g1_i1.p1  ORF type:complete len:214 (-),score=84.33 TRINITY_DN19271_c0_g1_i1:183-824(-)